MIAAIIGATGLVGQVLLETLLDSEQYHKVIVLGRNRPKVAEHHFGEEKLEYIQCQLDELHEINLSEKVDHAFCCLGTTIKQAGSQQAFIEVDKLGVVAFAKLLQAQGNPKLVLQIISAIDANPTSSIFYNRVKGQMQQAVEELQLPHVQFFQPSLLIGQRHQSRTFEDIGQRIFGLTAAFFIGPLKKYKPIQAESVAKAMFYSAQRPAKGSAIISNDVMHQLGDD